MAETDVHRDELVRLIQTLQVAFAADPAIYISGNLLLYYEQGNPRRSVSPDVFVVRGIPKLPRRDTYLLWEEGKPPLFVIEVTSSSTSREDRLRKKELYARLGVDEYILYDPRFPGMETRYPPLLGYRLIAGAYEPMAAEAAGALSSETLGLRLRLVDGWLRLFDPQTDAILRSPSELADAEHARADAEHARADAEHAHAEAERVRAEAEHVRAEAAEARVAELEALLAGRPSPESTP